MNQPRRTFLQCLLGLFGLVAAKAVANGHDPQADTLLHGWNDGTIRKTQQPKFNAAIGVVYRNGRLCLAIAFLNDPHGEKSDAESFRSIESSADYLAEQCPNAMIFAESNGPAGAQLVAELMKRCPERVWHQHRRPGYRTCFVPDGWPQAIAARNDWATDDKDEAMARSLAIIGKQILSGEAKELRVNNKNILAITVR